MWQPPEMETASAPAVRADCCATTCADLRLPVASPSACASGHAESLDVHQPALLSARRSLRPVSLGRWTLASCSEMTSGPNPTSTAQPSTEGVARQLLANREYCRQTTSTDGVETAATKLPSSAALRPSDCSAAETGMPGAGRISAGGDAVTPGCVASVPDHTCPDHKPSRCHRRHSASCVLRCVSMCWQEEWFAERRWRHQ